MPGAGTALCRGLVYVVLVNRRRLGLRLVVPELVPGVLVGGVVAVLVHIVLVRGGVRLVLVDGHHELPEELFEALDLLFVGRRFVGVLVVPEVFGVVLRLPAAIAAAHGRFVGAPGVLQVLGLRGVLRVAGDIVPGRFGGVAHGRVSRVPGIVGVVVVLAVVILVVIVLVVIVLVVVILRRRALLARQAAADAVERLDEGIEGVRIAGVLRVVVGVVPVLGIVVRQLGIILRILRGARVGGNRFLGHDRVGRLDLRRGLVSLRRLDRRDLLGRLRLDGRLRTRGLRRLGRGPGLFPDGLAFAVFICFMPPAQLEIIQGRIVVLSVAHRITASQYTSTYTWT